MALRNVAKIGRLCYESISTWRQDQRTGYGLSIGPVRKSMDLPCLVSNEVNPGPVDRNARVVESLLFGTGLLRSLEAEQARQVHQNFGC